MKISRLVTIQSIGASLILNSWELHVQNKLQKLLPKDFIFFVTSLVPYNEESYSVRTWRVMRAHQSRKMSKYIIGFYEIVGVFVIVVSLPENGRSYSIRKAIDNSEVGSSIIELVEPQIRQNAYFRRKEEKFVCAVGAKNNRTSLL